MVKYAVHSRWQWPDGVPSAETMQGWHREHRTTSIAEDIIWWQIDENTHQSIIIYSTEEDAKDDTAEARRANVNKQLMRLVIRCLKKPWGPILSIMSEA